MDTELEVALGRFSRISSNLDVISGVNSDIDLSIQENLISGLFLRFEGSFAKTWFIITI